MKASLTILCAGLLAGCAVTIPLGEDGRYGAIEVAYRLPATPWEREMAGMRVSNPPQLRGYAK